MALNAVCLGTQLGRVPEGGPDWKVVREKAKELQELATKALVGNGDGKRK